MYNIFLESIIFWIVVGAFLFIVGYAFSQDWKNGYSYRSGSAPWS